ncbi:MAG: cell division protein ZapA [Myxococcales bacterium]|nr:cell division protein ZapA [Myxococcales bacterium]
MSETRSVAVEIQGQQYRIRTDGDDAAVERVARYVDATMDRVRERTKTVDSRDVAVLSALNIAKELLAYAQGGGPVGADAVRVEKERIQALIERIDAAEQD